MTRAEAVAEILTGLGFRSDQEGAARDALKEAQRYFEMGRSLPWFLRTTSTIAVEEGEADAALPARFLRIREQSFPYYSPEPDILVFMVEMDLLTADNYSIDEVTGSPETYLIDRAAGLFKIWPIPDADYSITMHHYSRDEILTSDDDENKWLENVPELLIGRAGYRVAGKLRNKAAMDLFKEQWMESAAVLFNETVAQDEFPTPLFMGASF